MSGTNKLTSYYWDTCIYLAWLWNEEAIHGKPHMDAIAQISRDNFQLKNVIITSTVTIVEIGYARMTQQQKDDFEALFRPDSHIPHDLDRKIAAKARELRDTFSNEPKKLSTPDSIHLATAIVYGADEFHTFDDGKKSKFVGLLGLNGDQRVEKLKISKPVLPQGLLTLPPRDSAKELFDK